MRDFPPRVDELVGKMIQSDPSSVHFLVTDTIYSWPAFIADKHDLVNVSFWTQPALVLSIGYNLDLLRENGHFPCKDDLEEEINYIPGVDSISTKDLMPYLKESDYGGVMQRSVSIFFAEAKRRADFVLHNTVHEFESSILSALNQYLPNYAVGPINFSTINNTVSKSLWSESDCSQWIDSKSPGSVLYISFGSLVQTDERAIEEMAHGLLLSEANFIWVTREGTQGSPHNNSLPAGFEDLAKDRGLIIPWCNQIMVLSHPAVGGFLTHCGWNSTLESIWCGVPMICYPIYFDQYTIRKLVVDDWKIGINLCDGKTVDRNEVALKIRNLMSGSTSMGLKQEARKVKEILHDALKIDGSSERNFDQFVKDLKEALYATTM